MIRSTGFFRSKTKSIRGAAAAIVAEHGGRVPDTMKKLHGLPGVGLRLHLRPRPRQAGAEHHPTGQRQRRGAGHEPRSGAFPHAAALGTARRPEQGVQPGVDGG